MMPNPTSAHVPAGTSAASSAAGRKVRTMVVDDSAVIRGLITRMLEAEDDESAFLSIGLGYLKFAREEPQLFDLLFVKGKKKWNFTSRSPFLGPVMEKMRRDWYLKDLSDHALLGLFRDMFIYTHGLCTLQSIDIDRADPSQERKLLHDVGGQLIAMTVIREKNPAALEEMYRSLMS